MNDTEMDRQRFIDAAHERGEDTFTYIDPRSGESLLVSGSPASIQLLGEIVDDYGMVCEVVEGVIEEMDKRKEIGHAD
jgi:hypothetical protein